MEIPSTSRGGSRCPRALAHSRSGYTAPSFVKPEQIRFRYRLAGLDDEWIDAGDRRSASFHADPAGPVSIRGDCREP